MLFAFQESSAFGLTKRPLKSTRLKQSHKSTIDLLPRHKRVVNHIRDAIPADGLDCKVHAPQAERVCCHSFQREAFRGELFESKLARLVAVTASAFDRDEFECHLAQREIREL